MIQNRKMLLREILGLFFLGILLSGIFYFWFQNSFRPELDVIEGKLHTITSEKEQSMWMYLLVIAMERIKPFLFLWVMAQTRWKRPLLLAFIIWKGGNFGFLHAFLIHYYGPIGVWRGFLCQFPHMLFYIPSYLILFIIIENGEPRNVRRCFLCSLVLLLLGCLLEAYVGIPILRTMYSN